MLPAILKGCGSILILASAVSAAFPGVLGHVSMSSFTSRCFHCDLHSALRGSFSRNGGSRHNEDICLPS